MLKRRRLGAEQIVTKLRQIEVLQRRGKNIAAACKELERRNNVYSSRKSTAVSSGRVLLVGGAHAVVCHFPYPSALGLKIRFVRNSRKHRIFGLFIDKGDELLLEL